ncbi:hypothetical protein SAMN06265360_108174 [Haloechinothrix alba]|uniref:Uncharacterized protein n=1 Tax=Haloechinothrix alba TaxID=664784 RepID=A0A238X1I0_9PSEU|nr:hypothetical protein [Haloechinothrix alba]SNR52550.1 hypothetical protein SAMN06265360_108174 [Haloechinothrix alba]
MPESSSTEPQEPEATQQSSHESEAGVERAEHAGTALSRLLAVATLTPAQAGLLARDLAVELEALRRGGRYPAGFTDRRVLLTGSGSVVIATGDGVDTEQQGEPDGQEPGEVGHGRSVTHHVAGLVRKLAASARRDGVRQRDEADLLVQGLDELGDDVGALAEHVRQAATRLLRDVPDDRIDILRAELASLAGAIAGREPELDDEQSEKDQSGAASWSRSETHGADLRLRGWRRSRRRAWHSKPVARLRWLLVFGLVAGLVAAGSLWGLPNVVSDIQRGWGALMSSDEPQRQLAPVTQEPGGQEDAGDAEPDGETSGAQGSGDRGEGAARTPRDVELLAPEEADPITEVAVELLEETCEPGQACPLRVDVHMDREGTNRAVEWSLHVVDRCSDSVEEQPGMAVTAQSGWGQVYGISRPELPESSSLAVMAVTQEPVRVSSQPLEIPADGGTC